MKKLLKSFVPCMISFAMLTGCGSAPSSSVASQEVTDSSSAQATVETPEPTAEPTPEDSTEWIIEPQYSFDEMVPLYSRIEYTAGYGTAADYYVVRSGEYWSLYSLKNQNILLKDRLTAEPYLYSSDMLIYEAKDAPSEYNLDQEKAIADDINQELQSDGAEFTVGVGGMGGFGNNWIYTDDHKIYLNYIGAYEFSGTLLSDVQDAPALFGIQQASWSDEYQDYVIADDAPYAICDKDGNFLSDFQYKNVCMYGQDLIAVEDQNENWGYCDKTGAFVIPCEYKAILHCGDMYESYDVPFPDMSEVVVVMNADGQKEVFKTDGTLLIDADTYEDICPAQNGNLWVKQNGLWGLMRL